MALTQTKLKLSYLTPVAAQYCNLTTIHVAGFGWADKNICCKIWQNLSTDNMLMLSANPLTTTSKDVAKMVICALVGSRLDYANSVLFGTSQKNILYFIEHRTSLHGLLLVPFSSVHIIFSSSCTGCRL